MKLKEKDIISGHDHSIAAQHYTQGMGIRPACTIGTIANKWITTLRENSKTATLLMMRISAGVRYIVIAHYDPFINSSA